MPVSRIVPCSVLRKKHFERGSISVKIRRPVPDMRPQREAILARIMPEIIVTERGCWEWQGHRTCLDYGELHWEGRCWVLHRLMYACTHGAFDPQLDVLHGCDNPPCCRFEHLRLGDMFDNQQERVAKGRHYLAQRTLCSRGHELSGENLYVSPEGHRRCKRCNLIVHRIRAGWPEEVAVSLETARPGFRPLNIPKKLKLRERIERPPRTTCKNGHELVGDAVYLTPAGRIECKICRRAAALRWLKNRIEQRA
jgi:hypothetical protein